ncbi:MAG: hypothetical protein B6U73_04320 [Desulfurococcales archaeon ex4484_204]|nr:MAG: hypothetical protein B6U73_04320 [Desulfurococcales archaeon ex4484_204]
MDYGEHFKAIISSLIVRFVSEGLDIVRRAFRAVADAFVGGGVLHVIGAGHSATIAEELSFRVGGLAPVNPFMDTNINVSHSAHLSTLLEGVRRYAEALLRARGVRSGDVVLVVSTSGVNTFPVEAALRARAIGITLREYSLKPSLRNPWGRRLFEVVDIAIDSKVPPEDAALSIPGLAVKVAPVSTILNSFIAGLIVAYSVDYLVKPGVKLPVWLSTHLLGAGEHNKELFRAYAP